MLDREVEPVDGDDVAEAACEIERLDGGRLGHDVSTCTGRAPREHAPLALHASELRARATALRA